ncbi:MAG: hypothetical protein VB086_07485 [Clostridiaceae bacterium]|nr:hypothetical protein [Clostridiaceae bacterium]
MNNNKNRLRDRPKSDAELRKTKPKDNADLGVHKTPPSDRINEEDKQ